ncbi:UNVERIFIED_CONTAM: hypothetical protein RMT77_000563 [Armadillidium vulgare]
MSRVPVSPVHYTGASARPVFIQPSQFSGGSNSGGFTCLCCTICPCIHLGFLRTVPGLLKIIELILCSICQSLLLRYGVSVSSTIGSSFTIFLTTVSSCLLLVALLLFCYVISQNSFSLIRSSVLEVVFNVVACFLYLSSAAHLSWAVQIHVLPNYLLIPGYAAYPAMTACYILGIVLGIVHGFDSYFAYKQLKGR